MVINTYKLSISVVHEPLIGSGCRAKSKDNCALEVHGMLHTDGPSKEILYVIVYDKMIEIQTIEGG